MTVTDLPIPTYAQNMRMIGFSDQGGRPDGQQIMVHRGCAYIAHVCSRGFGIVDVGDPTHPRAVNYIENPLNTRSLDLQVHDDLLLLVHARDMFTQPEMADERNYYKPRADDYDGSKGTHERNWSAGMEFEPTVDAPGPKDLQTALGDDVLLLVEKWASAEALEAHLQAPHMIEYFASMKDLVAHAVVHVRSKA